MYQYIKDLLPRLQQLNKSIDHTASIIDKSWIYIDDDEKKHTYIFQKNGALIMSLNGSVTTGTWKFLPHAGSLLIDRGADKILLKHVFLDKAIIILRKDNNYDIPWILIDENVIPDLNVEKYLRAHIIKQLTLKEFRSNGSTYYYSDPDNIGVSRESVFYDENLNFATISITVKDKKIYKVENGVVNSSFLKLTFRTDKGNVTVISKDDYPSVGDRVLINGEKVADDSYTIRNHFFIRAL